VSELGIVEPVVEVGGTPGPVTAGHPGMTRRLLRDPLGLGAVAGLALMVAACVLAPLLTGQDPRHADLAATLAPPGHGHLLGGDGAGRDVFSRLLYGGRMTLLGATVAMVVAVVVGAPAGLAAGYYGRWVDAAASWLSNMVMSVPGIVLLLAVAVITGPNILWAMAIFGVVMAPGMFRLARSTVMAVRNELYVDAARVFGLTDARIIRRHVLRVVRAPLIIQASISFGIAIVVQSGIEFLGLGSPNAPSWGAMLNDAFTNLYTDRLLLLWPCLAIGLAVGGCAILGGALRDALEDRSLAPRQRRDSRPSVPAEAAADARDASVSAVAEATPEHPELLVVEGLRIAYQRGEEESVVVDGVSLAVRRREVVGLVGESGSGKTQTAYALLGLLPPDARMAAGRLAFDGQDMSAVGGAAGLRGRRLAYVPQEPMSNLDPAFRIGSQLTEPMLWHLDVSWEEAHRRALELLERVGIPDPDRVFDAYPHQLSGGMAQRVLIASAISCDPEVLIADEPTTALDVTVQAEVLDLLRSLQRERGMGMLLVSHDLGVVADLCDRVAVMQAGRIVEAAPVGRLFADPRHEYTRMLLASTLEHAAPRAALAGRASAVAPEALHEEAPS
jgi:peptide/nickel transport system permease protein